MPLAVVWESVGDADEVGGAGAVDVHFRAGEVVVAGGGGAATVVRLDVATGGGVVWLECGRDGGRIVGRR